MSAEIITAVRQVTPKASDVEFEGDRQGSMFPTVQIWIDVEDGFQNHYYISAFGERMRHYYHFDELLNWHATDIINARRVLVITRPRLTP